MSDQGEKTCPLCAEEMDLTDQQLKPCKCGYQICVWCWHHIMDMAEKDETDGRCPACRTPYDKEKIVGMAASCERVVSEVSMERKKSQKSKTKPSEGRKQLSSVRVIQRNLVYIVGLPLNLADEDLLQCKDYFGQYGRVLKVSMSRTAAGVVQQFPNNTCSVYITYSKEEEAIRCIQSVHGFVLDGRSLKACFGTTKYCHAWLRNMPCNNPDCLYLHEIGSQEDSFTKDEIISAYTRSRVQQITGATNNLQRRSGTMLPPPMDDYCSDSSSAKPIVKTATNSTASVPKSSPPNGSFSRSVALPAAASWGMRASNHQSVPNSASLNGSSNKQRPNMVNGIVAFSSGVTSTGQVPVSDSDVLKKPPLKEDRQAMVDKSKPQGPKSMQQNTSPDMDPVSNQIPCSLASTYSSRDVIMPVVNTDSSGHSKEGNTDDDESIHKLCADVASMGINKNLGNDHSGLTMPSGILSHQGFFQPPGNEGLQPHHVEQCRDHSSLETDGRAATSSNGVCVSEHESEWETDLQAQVGMNTRLKLDEDILSFNSQRLKDPEVMCHSTYSPNSANSIHVPNHLGFLSSQYGEVLGGVNSSSDSFFSGNPGSDRLLLSNGFAERPIGSSVGSSVPTEHSSFFSNGERRENQTGEDHIITNILSMDFDPWDESLASPNLSKLLGETDQEPSSLKLSNPLKTPHNSQSRFSFARQEESNNQAFEVGPYNVFEQKSKDCFSFEDSAASRDPYLDRLGIHNGFTSSYSEGLENFASSAFSPNKISVSRAQISAPPGFSIPSRSTPPGFSSNERMDQTFDGTRFVDSSSLLRNSYQAPPASRYVGGGATDIEFMDPAILAVGRGRLQGGHDNAGLDVRSGFLPQLNSFENEARLQLLMQRSLSAQQTLGFSDIRDNNFSSSLGDSYGIASRLMDQSQGIGLNGLSSFAQLSRQPSSNSLMSNGHWDRWSNVQGQNSMGMAELLRNDHHRLGFSNLYNGYEESKFQMPSSADLYNRTYRM